ncbi:MAG: hypothetical protein ABJG68_10455 [Crocinitomicaceae bacterium]
MMDRKQFLVTSTLAAFSLSAFGKVSLDENNQFAGDCETTNDILGPFYRPKAPIRKDMLFEGLKGNRISIVGKVYTDDCKTVLEDALVEVWHCDTEGNYDNKSSKMLHRARWVTDKKGNYAFDTIIPGKYLNGKLYRPSHIHFRVSCAGHQELISQIYFAGDPHITEDPWASQKKAEHRILSLNPVNIKGGLEVNFDIFLKKK